MAGVHPDGKLGYDRRMTRSEAITCLNHYAGALRARGATALYMFGSTVREDARPESDLDLFIDYDDTQKFSLFDLVGIKLFLEEALKTKVDVTTRDSLHPLLRADIERSAVRVF
jgi:predicted nucleotidyltransferase